MEPENLLNSVDTFAERINSAVWSDEDSSEGKEKGNVTIKKQRIIAIKKEWVSKRLIGHKLTKKTGSEAALIGIKELVRGIVRGAALGFALKGGMGLVFGVLQRKSSTKIWNAVFNQDVLKFTRFLAAYIGVFRGINAFLAAYRSTNHKSNTVVAGMISSVAILLDDSSRRKDISLYLFCRALYVFTRMLVRKKVLPEIWWFERFFFGFVNIPIMYGFFYEPDLLQPGYYKWIRMMGNMTEESMQSTMRDPRDAFFNTGAIIDLKSAAHYHDGPCTVYCVTDWCTGLLRAAKVYAPVHLVPLLLFRYKQLISSPGSTLTKTGKGFLASCLFLTTYQSFQKINICTFRNQIHRDQGYIPVLGAMLTGFATIFEKKARVTELLLYCCPRGAEGAWNWLRKYGYVKDVPFAEVFLFSIASSILLSASSEDFKPTYYRALAFLIGS